jgi:hypothetical protein
MVDKTSTSPPKPPKRRRIVDVARANAFRVGDAGVDLDAAIDAAITAAMKERERRSRPKQTND